MLVVIILLIPTAIFFIRSLAALGRFLKWRKKELLIGTVGELENLKASGKARKYTYAFTIRRGDGEIQTHINCTRMEMGNSRYKPGDVLPVWYDPQTGRYRVKKEVLRDLWLNPLLFAVFGGAAFGVYSIAPKYTMLFRTILLPPRLYAALQLL